MISILIQGKSTLMTPGASTKRVTSTSSKRPTAVTVYLLKKYSKKLPKNSARRQMSFEGRRKTIFFSRGDDSVSVEEKILSTFQIEKYTVLECNSRTHQLIVSPLKNVNGSHVIQRRRAFCICEVSSLIVASYTLGYVEVQLTYTVMIHNLIGIAMQKHYYKK